MSVFKNFLSKFRKKENKNELSELNKSCNMVFERIFNRCRQELGSELLEIMNIKKSIMDISNRESFTSIQELLAKKILSLIHSYLNLADSYVKSANSLKGLSNSPSEIDDIIKANKEKLNQIHSLIKSLNLQLNLNSTDTSISSESEEIINEAIALNNVLQERMTKKF